MEPIDVTQAETASDYIRENWASIFHPSFQLVLPEFKVYGTIIAAEPNERWHVDYFARHCGKPYLVECDINASAQDAWHVFKIIGYRAAYCLDTNKKVHNVGVMAFISDRIYNHRVRNVLAVSGIEFCVFKKQDSCWRMVRSSLKIGA